MRILDFSDGYTSNVAPTSVAFAASGVSVATIAGLAATNAQTAFVEILGDINSHIANSSGAHSASAISSTASGSITATNVQAAINQAATQIAANAAAISAAPSATQTLTNKTFGDAPTFAQVATPASPAAGYNKIYPKADGNFYTMNSAGVETQVGSGAGGGSVNLIKYGDAESGATTGWSLGTIGTLTNSLPTGTPTFGSGAAGTLTFSTVSSGQLTGTYSYSLASSAATTAGNMLATDALPVALSYQSKVLTFKFDYSATSGSANANWSGTKSNSFAVAVYDVTNSSWIGQSANFGLTQGSGVGTCSGTFQTNSNTASIRFVIYCANATTGAVTLLLDNVSVGPQTVVGGPVITDWVPYTPTFNGFGTPTTVSVQSRRNGDSLEIMGSFTSGTATAVPARFTIGYNGGNANVNIDIAKLTQSTNVGSTVSSNSSTTFFDVGVVAVGGTNYISFTAGTSTSNLSTPANGSAVAASGTGIGFSVKVPIVGWSSNVQMSSDTDTRVIAMAAYQGLSVSVTTTPQKAPFTTTSFDTAGAFQSASNSYVVPVSGIYEITYGFPFNSASASIVVVGQVYKNGVAAATGAVPLTTSSTNYLNVTRKIQCSAGDILALYVWTTAGTCTLPSDAGTTYFIANRLSGPSVIAATESVVASYGLTTAQSVALNAKVLYDTKVKDSHNAFNTATGDFTVPISGTYLITAVGITSSGTPALWIKNQAGGGLGYLTTANTSTIVSGSATVPLLAGQTVAIAVNAAATMLGTQTFGFVNSVTFTRIGQ